MVTSGAVATVFLDWKRVVVETPAAGTMMPVRPRKKFRFVENADLELTHPGGRTREKARLGALAVNIARRVVCLTQCAPDGGGGLQGALFLNC